MATQKNIFSRVQAPDPKFDGVINDIYDKLAHLSTVPASVTPTPTPTPTPTTIVIPSGSGGGAAPSLYAFTDVPLLAAVPSNNPVTGAPYAVDGVLVDVGGVIYRYAGAPTYQWQIIYAPTIYVGASSEGRPPDSATAAGIQIGTLPEAGTFPANFSTALNSSGVTNPTSAAVITFKVNTTTIGTLSISTGGAFTFATVGGTSKTFVAGDEFQVIWPSPQDATLARVSFVLKAKRI